MGNFEKLVVLTVLFLSAIVLAVSLSSDDDGKEGLNPFEDAAMRAGGDESSGGNLALSAEGDRVGTKSTAPAARKPRADGPNPTGDPKTGTPAEASAKKNDVAKSTVEDDAAAPVATNAKGHPRVLQTLQGLTVAPLDEYMVYTPVAGDTWSGLAARFYQSTSYIALLRAANEDLESPRAGDAILVPVYDFRSAPKNHEPRKAAPARHTASDDTGSKTTGADGVYTVVEGDSLWKISTKEYGSGSRWMEIFEANKNVLATPDDLTLGQKLRIPR